MGCKDVSECWGTGTALRGPTWDFLSGLLVSPGCWDGNSPRRRTEAPRAEVKWNSWPMSTYEYVLNPNSAPHSSPLWGVLEIWG